VCLNNRLVLGNSPLLGPFGLLQPWRLAGSWPSIAPRHVPTHRPVSMVFHTSWSFHCISLWFVAAGPICHCVPSVWRTPFVFPLACISYCWTPSKFYFCLQFWLPLWRQCIFLLLANINIFSLFGSANCMLCFGVCVSACVLVFVFNLLGLHNEYQSCDLRAGSVAQMVEHHLPSKWQVWGPEFKPQYCKKKKMHRHFFGAVLRFELRAHILSHSTSLFLCVCDGYF
jgi:hypothetical protein